ncbi:MAG: AMP-binding protein [Flavobacteriales bacterium]
MKNYYFIENKKYSHDEFMVLINHAHSDVPTALHDGFEFVQMWFNQVESFVVKTSGSTGTPKSIVIMRQQMEASAKLTIQHFALQDARIALLCLPVSFIAGKMMLVRTWVGGWNLIWNIPSSNPIRDVHERIDFAAFTPMQVINILNTCPEKFEAVKKVIIGGGEISHELESKLKNCNNEVWVTYGMTETITHVASRKLSGNDASNEYHALPGISFTITHDGRLIIRAAHLGSHQYTTNDVVQLHSPTSFSFVGRADHVINSGGVKIFPEQVEQKLAPLIAVPFYISAEADEVLGERVVLYMQTDALSPSQIAMWIEQMKTLLHPYEVPKMIYALPKIERTPTGKIMRR